MAKKQQQTYNAPGGIQNTGARPTSPYGGMAPVGGARYGAPPASAINIPPVSVGVPVYGGGMQPRPQQQRPAAPRPLSKKEQKKLARRKRREKDYFFVMRKSVCFFIFLFCLVVFAFSAVGVAGAFVSLPDMVSQYTAVAIEPDLTPTEERTDTTDPETDETVVYQDTSKYYTAGDLMLSAVNGLFELSFFVDEDGNTKAAFYNETLEALNAIPEETEDSMASIATMLFQYGPLAMALTLVSSLIAMITSFLGMFGKRIFKGFGLAGILMLLGAVCMLTSGLIGYGVTNGHPKPAEDNEEAIVSVMDFGSLMPYITGAFQGVPETAEELEGEDAVTYMNFTAGIGALGLLGGSVLVIVFSLFARKKVPYSIFDR